MRQFSFLFMIFLCCYFCTPASASIQFVQQKTGNNGNSQNTTLQVTFDNPTTAGDLIVVYVAPDTTQPGTITVTDGHNTYVAATSTLTTGECSMSQEFFYAANIVGGSDTITATTTSANGMIIVAMEYSGVATTAPLDGQAGTSQPSCPYSTSPASASFSTANSNDLIVSAAILSATGPTWTAGAGDTLRTGTALIFGGEDEAVSSTGTYSGTFNLSGSGNWLAAAVAFKAAGGFSSATPTCGRASDGSNQVPSSNWATFTGPAGKGQTAADFSFGCTFTQITDSTADCGTNYGMVVYYNTNEVFSADDKKVWLSCLNGKKEIVDWKTNYPTPYTVISSSQFPPVQGVVFWDLTDGNSFYGTTSTSLVKYTLTNWPTCVTSQITCTFSPTTLKDFTTAGFMRGCLAMDTPDISQDGKYLLLACQNTAGGNISVVLWNITNGVSDMTYVSTCQGSLGVQPGCIHKIQISADNGMLLGFANNCSGGTCNGEQGLVYWNPSKNCASTNPPGTTSLNGGQFQCRVQGQTTQGETDHVDAGFDLSGNSIVGFGAAPNVYPGTNPCSTIGGSVWSGIGIFLVDNVLNSSNPTPNCPWGGTVLTPPYHIGYRGGASQPWILLNMFDSRSQSPEYFGANSPVAQTGNCDSGTDWCTYEDEIMLARVDNNSLTGNGIWRLAHGYCRSDESYWNQCLASMSRDGKYIALTSSMLYGPTGCPNPQTWNLDAHGNPSPNDCENVYIISAANGASLFQ